MHLGEDILNDTPRLYVGQSTSHHDWIPNRREWFDSVIYYGKWDPDEILPYKSTILQCVAMNRSLTNVLFGGIGATAPTETHKIEGVITKTSVEDTVEALANADSVILVT